MLIAQVGMMHYTISYCCQIERQLLHEDTKMMGVEIVNTYGRLMQKQVRRFGVLATTSQVGVIHLGFPMPMMVD